MLLMFIVLQRKCNWDPSASLVALILSNHRPRTTSAASPTPCEPITPFLSPCSLISLLSRLQKGGFLLIFMRDRNVVLQIMTNIQKQQQRLRGRPNVSRSANYGRTEVALTLANDTHGPSQFHPPSPTIYSRLQLHPVWKQCLLIKREHVVSVKNYLIEMGLF